MLEVLTANIATSVFFFRVGGRWVAVVVASWRGGGGGGGERGTDFGR